MIKFLNGNCDLLTRHDKNSILFNEDLFIYSVSKIAEDIKKNFYMSKKIGLVGIARGALPLLVAVSHELGIRNVNVFQVVMSKSDSEFDFDEVAKIYDGYVDKSCDCYIIFEDIVSKGRSVNVLLEEFLKKKLEVSAVYSLFVKEDFIESGKLLGDTDLRYVFPFKTGEWVYFFWEKKYRILKNKFMKG